METEKAIPAPYPGLPDRHGKRDAKHLLKPYSIELVKKRK